VVELATQGPFRQVSTTLDKLTAGVLAPVAIYRISGQVAQETLGVEEEVWGACFEAGEAPPPAPKGVSVLFRKLMGCGCTCSGRLASTTE
jgi:hypothetical protein